MSVLKLVIAPDPILQKCSQVVERITPEITKLAGDMLDTMYESNG
jgi:peptide deformylase